MRMWKVRPKEMCLTHLLGEHVEMHMFVGTINKGISVKGYIEKNLVEIHHIKARHDKLAAELLRRGCKHKSPLPEFESWNEGKVSTLRNRKALRDRCSRCKKRQMTHRD